jgi:hypothetical protein
MKQKSKDVSEGVNFSALGQAIVDEAIEICHRRHLDGEKNPPWSECLQQAQKIVIPKFMNVKKEGGYTNGKKAQASTASPMREVEEHELGINRDYDSLYAFVQKSQISAQ